ncbi:ATP-dependent 6-phosphofructokinase [Aeromicrobium piscarium]|nr:ATP-dependent 6-phosphofructokinase [Aeromicrobium piscarium]
MVTYDDMSLADLQVRSLGEARYDSPLAEYVAHRATNAYYVAEDDRVLIDDTISLLASRGDVPLDEVPSYEPGGPRRKIFFDPATTKAGIVTCGGLCPGLNDVIRALVLELFEHYGVTDVTGFRNGYAGLAPGQAPDPIELTPSFVQSIAERGGTVLGSSRGSQEVGVMVDTLVDRGIDILFVIGGDGSMRGAHAIHEEIARRELSIAVVGVPKTIDNDIPLIGTSFGFQTAYAKAAESIKAARVESDAAVGGVAVVKVMGRHAGFVACYSALAYQDADFVLIPEVPFSLDGENGLLAQLAKRVSERGSAVIVLAEGAGQDLIPASRRTDASGNQVLGDFSGLLRARIARDFKDRGMPLTLRHFDPGYLIRSVPADAADSVYCTRLAQVAVHAAMAGRTDIVVGRPRHRFAHVPIEEVTKRTQRVNPDGDLWLSVMESTGQPFTMH